jgi:protein associated with RNAse G/E
MKMHRATVPSTGTSVLNNLNTVTIGEQSTVITTKSISDTSAVAEEQLVRFELSRQFNINLRIRNKIS